MVAASRKLKRPRGAPDLYEYKRRYPLTVANFGALADREAWLDRVWETDVRWRESLEDARRAKEAIVKGAPPAGLQIEGEFEVIYAGGVLGLLHAAVMTSRFGRRVMVFDENGVGQSGSDWNMSDDELQGFERSQLFTRGEVEGAVKNRSRSGFVKFYDASSRVKAPPLWVDGVLNVAVEADKLLALATAKVERSGTGSALLNNLRFVRCYLQPARVLVEVEDTRTRKRSLFGARLFVDSTGTGSAVARQLNNGRTVTHVCPTVGTVSRGFVRGEEPNQVDFHVSEILVSKDDARDHRQLIWGGFAGNSARDEYATYLFFYDAVESPADKSLLALFERYFEQLPGYKRAGAQWRVKRPVFGHVQGAQPQTLRGKRRTAEDRVMLIGEADGLSVPLTHCRLGANVRRLQSMTHLVELALSADLLDAASLAEINVDAPRVAQMSGLAEFLRPTRKSAPSSVNETLNAMMAALHSLDERVRRELFQDRMSFSALKRLLSRTVKLYPRIIERVREHFGARGTFLWLANIATAAFSERRRGSRSVPEEDQSEDPAQKFVRYLALYKNEPEEN